MKNEPLISSQILAPIVKYMRAVGCDEEKVARLTGIELAHLADVDSMIPLRRYVTFMETAAAIYNIPHFGMNAARKIKTEAIGPISFLYASAPTLHDALKGLVSFISVIQQGTNHALIIKDDEVVSEYKIETNTIAPRSQDAEYSISANFENIRQYLKSPFTPKEVRFEHEQIGAHETYSDYFGCDVFFEQPTNSLVFDRSLLAIKNPSISKKLYPILSSHMQNIVSGKDMIVTMTDQVISALSSDVLASGAKSSIVAEKLGLTPSTLARRLKREGTSYSKIVMSKKTSLAKRLLQHSNTPISHIALKVGYSENASFTRAFKASTGMTPDNYRQLSRSEV